MPIYNMVINQLNPEYAPYERMQIISVLAGVDPPSQYLYFPAIPPGCEIVAELNMSRIRDLPIIHKLNIYDINNQYKHTAYILGCLDQYFTLLEVPRIYTTITQYDLNHLNEYGFIYDSSIGLYCREVLTQ